MNRKEFQLLRPILLIFSFREILSFNRVTIWAFAALSLSFTSCTETALVCLFSNSSCFILFLFWAISKFNSDLIKKYFSVGLSATIFRAYFSIVLSFVSMIWIHSIYCLGCLRVFSALKLIFAFFLLTYFCLQSSLRTFLWVGSLFSKLISWLWWPKSSKDLSTLCFLIAIISILTLSPTAISLGHWSVW